MILENQYGVGDVVTVNGITGTVEDVGLRITTIRDFDGTVWYVANGSVTELGNRSQGWSVAVVDVPVAHSSDLELAKEVLLQTVTDLQHDERWASRLMPDEPIVGVESIAASAVTMRIRLHTVHEQQVPVARELRVRSVKALEAAGVQMPSAMPTSGAPTPLRVHPAQRRERAAGRAAPRRVGAHPTPPPGARTGHDAEGRGRSEPGSVPVPPLHRSRGCPHLTCT